MKTNECYGSQKYIVIHYVQKFFFHYEQRNAFWFSNLSYYHIHTFNILWVLQCHLRFFRSKQGREIGQVHLWRQFLRLCSSQGIRASFHICLSHIIIFQGMIIITINSVTRKRIKMRTNLITFLMGMVETKMKWKQQLLNEVRKIVKLKFEDIISQNQSRE